jgi:hypothetical protein
MRRFPALERGACMGKRPWAGSVLSVHARVLNILRADGLMVSIIADHSSMSAMGVLAPELFQTRPDPGLGGAPAVMEDAVLCIRDVAAIECAGCLAWEGMVEPAAVRALSPAAIKIIRESLLVHGNPAGMLGMLQARGNVFVEHARAALTRGQPEDLVGCGPGLTPAGDDFLVGAMLASSGAGSLRLAGKLTGTTPAGRTLLWMAMHGRFPAYLLQFIDDAAAAGVSPKCMDAAVLNACSHGETSGTDAVSGFCWLRCWSGLQRNARSSGRRSPPSDRGAECREIPTA